MSRNLLEAYSKRIAVAESVFKKENNGRAMDNHRKLVIAKCLENTNKFLNEAFDHSMGTQRSEMGLFKKFCMNLTNVALPNLIAHDLVITYPMSSMSGYITYVKYNIGTTKGGLEAGTTIRDAFHERMDPQSEYTSARVVETAPAGEGEVEFTPAWTPVIGNVQVEGENGWDDVVANEDGKFMVPGGARVRYIYNNIIVPQNSLPTIKAEMEAMPLLAKARRIAVFYSQIAAFQAKTDYGFDLGDQLAEQAVGQLAYEIDTEIVEMLYANAKPDERLTGWSTEVPVGVSKRDHYEAFAEVVEMANQIIYDRTRKFAATYMVCASNVARILTFIPGFNAAPKGKINGPYFAGTLNGLKVFVSPALKADEFFFGVNGDDMMSSAAVYAPYMPVVPTQLLQYADGGTSQGWSTLYDLKMLNDNLLVKGSIVDMAMKYVAGSQNAPIYTA